MTVLMLNNLSGSVKSTGVGGVVMDDTNISNDQYMFELIIW